MASSRQPSSHNLWILSIHASVSWVHSRSRFFIEVILAVVPPEYVAIIVRWRPVVKGFGQNVVKKELSGLFVVDSTWGSVEGEYGSTKILITELFDVVFEFWTGSVILSPITFTSNSTFTTFGFSFLPKILSPNVLSFVGEIGNVINKTPVIPNKAPVKDAAIISPGIWIFFHIFMIIPKRI